MSERKSAIKWAAEADVEILDPDGWRKSGTSMYAAISRKRFIELASVSTVKNIDNLMRFAEYDQEPETVTVEVLHKSENLPQSGYKRELDISTPEGALFMKNPRLVSLRFEYDDGSWGVYRRVK